MKPNLHIVVFLPIGFDYGKVEELSDLGFESLYHFKTKELQGLETKVTYFHHKKENASHHIDYLFCSKDMLSSLDLDIQEYDDWIELSDHMPLIMNMEEK